MSQAPVLPWFAVNELMDDTYRAIVVRIAMQHLSQAPADLQTMARASFSAVPVRGFRSFSRADARSAIAAVIAAMPKRPEVATAVISLWGDATTTVIDTLRQAAQAQNVQFQPDWSWRQAQEGYVPFDEVSALEQVCDEVAKDRTKPESDHLRLAVLWLSRSVIPNETKESTNPSEEIAQPD